MANNFVFMPGSDGPTRVLAVDSGLLTPDGKPIFVPVSQSVGSMIVKSVEFTRPANTTAYTAKDAVNVNLACSAATNASPIVVTCATHGLVDGDVVTISGITGNTNANGTFFAMVTGYSTTTFALYSDKALVNPVAGNGAYGGTGLIARLWTLRNVFRIPGGSGYIMKARILTDQATCTDVFRLHFYKSPVAAQLDNVAFTLLYANRASQESFIDLPAMTTEGTGSDSARSTAAPNTTGIVGLPLFVYNGDTVPSQDLYMRIENITATPGTPASAQNYFVEITLDSN